MFEGLLIALSCVCCRKGGLNAETEELVDGDPRLGTARSTRCNSVLTRQRLDGEASEERSPPSQASAWSRPSTGIKEQEGLRCDREARGSLDAVSDPHPEGASPSPQGVLRDGGRRTDALRGGGD